MNKHVESFVAGVIAAALVFLVGFAAQSIHHQVTVVEPAKLRERESHHYELTLWADEGVLRTYITTGLPEANGGSIRFKEKETGEMFVISGVVSMEKVD